MSPSTTTADPPPLSALFLIEFDVKAGYTLLWKQAASPEIQLDDVVEFKSLPSGLHEVPSDLVYFVHEGGYAGLSAFANAKVDDEDLRNARMLAVGVLVPLSYGRLGRAWQHTAGVQELAQQLAVDMTKTALLEAYWKAHAANLPGAPNATADSAHVPAPLSSPSTSTFGASASLEINHPAYSITRLLDSFGPLIFPLFRASLLRKRILISCHAPVHEVNDFVYDLSILSNIPSSLTDILPPGSPTQCLRPLFTIGVHDIPLLASNLESLRTRTPDDTGSGWIACTTDSIFACKQTLWDVLVTLPSPSTATRPDNLKQWPTLQTSSGAPIKASQRDLRRYTALKAGLAQLSAPQPPSTTSTSPDHGDQEFPRRASIVPPPEASDTTIAELVEPMTWTALAYTGFMWWASAGEQAHSIALDEEAADATLLANLISPAPAPGPPPGSAPHTRYRDNDADQDTPPHHSPHASRRASLSAPAPTSLQDPPTRTNLAIVAYFHRLTAQILGVAADVAATTLASPSAVEVDCSALDAGDDAGDTSPAGAGDYDDEHLLVLDDSLESRGTRVGSHVLEAMGLDVWSVADTNFVESVMDMYFERSVRIETKGVEVCGVRVC
ncbi:hypothetical protein BROUX41_004176 [Berkeleyomyces rouxiae]|uniref:uncharacterized protein n=1 Tax=Berkeleyomyces rouxiae TaxID=2035830 RepID=UPI003B7BCE22